MDVNQKKLVNYFNQKMREYGVLFEYGVTTATFTGIEDFFICFWQKSNDKKWAIHQLALIHLCLKKMLKDCHEKENEESGRSLSFDEIFLTVYIIANEAVRQLDKKCCEKGSINCIQDKEMLTNEKIAFINRVFNTQDKKILERIIARATMTYEEVKGESNGY